jgi:hypothetical protein
MKERERERERERDDNDDDDDGGAGESNLLLRRAREQQVQRRGESRSLSNVRQLNKTKMLFCFFAFLKVSKGHGSRGRVGEGRKRLGSQF